MAETKTKKRVKAPAYDGSLDRKFSKCAHCGIRKQVKGNFGVRYMGPTRGYRVQSWCNKCRWSTRTVTYEFEVVDDIKFDNGNSFVVDSTPAKRSPLAKAVAKALNSPEVIREAYAAAFPTGNMRLSPRIMLKRLQARKVK